MSIAARLAELLREKGIDTCSAIIERARCTSLEEAESILLNACETHQDDPNFPDSLRELGKYIGTKCRGGCLVSSEQLDTSNSEETKQTEQSVGATETSQEAKINQILKNEEIKIEAVLIEYHSPYPEVRCVTDPVDSPDMPAETFRMYALGCIWVAIGTFVNQFFTTRQPSISISAPLLQLLVYPCGKFWERSMPQLAIGHYELNPGFWTQKEQMLVTIMFNISLGLPYANSQIFVQRLPMFYGNAWAASYGYQFMLLLSTQLVGFGAAGIFQSILVSPSYCIWPSSLPSLALNRALMLPEKQRGYGKATISNFKFFLIISLSSFTYFWFPNYLFEGLSNFSWLSWINPKSFGLAAVTDMYGLGINPLPTLDWNILNSNSCLVTPFFSYANTMIGAALSGMIIIPALYWSNYKDTGYLPINSNRLFTNTGKPFKVGHTLSDGMFDEGKYQKYSPPFYSAAALVVYGAFFAYYPATIVYALLYHGKTIKVGLIRMIDGLKRKTGMMSANGISIEADPHCIMMARYPSTPQWWYFCSLGIALTFAVMCVKLYPTDTPVWTIFVAVLLGVVFLVPIGLMEAITNTSIGINVLTELISGFALPGNGTAMMIMKAFGYNTNAQALHICADMKLGHYAKIPPRATFRAQVLATILCTTITILVANWQIDHYQGICTPGQPQKFTCPGETTYFSASVFWGVIGPRRIFGANGLYPILPYCFLIGAFIPVPFYILKKMRPSSAFVRCVNPLVVLSGMLSYAPYSIAFYTGGFWISILSHKIVRKRFTRVWEKYNYVLSCGLDSGVAIAAIIIFFGLQYRGIFVEWWGNSVVSNQLSQEPRLKSPHDEGWYFGPRRGSYP